MHPLGVMQEISCAHFGWPLTHGIEHPVSARLEAPAQTASMPKLIKKLLKYYFIAAGASFAAGFVAMAVWLAAGH